MNDDEARETGTRMKRRRFLLLAAAAVTGSRIMGCGECVQAARADQLLDLGPATDYASDGLYAALQDQGVFVIRKDGKVVALSAFCTHRRCKLMAQADHSFLRKCDGSTFDPGDKVTEGPATRDLPVIPVVLNEKGHLIAKISRH